MEKAILWKEDFFLSGSNHFNNNKKQKNKNLDGFFYYKIPAFCFTRYYLWIIEMLPSIGEQIM